VTRTRSGLAAGASAALRPRTGRAAACAGHGGVLGQERQRRLGVARADDLEPQLGQPEQPRVERPDDVDRLHPAERHAAAALGEHAALDLQLGRVTR
jgi:hypothetical protein